MKLSKENKIALSRIRFERAKEFLQEAKFIEKEI